jgi:MoxR-like ATPase
MALTKTARIIVKSRLRRHGDALLVAQHINGSYGADNVSNLTTAQLEETAGKFGIGSPLSGECGAFDDAKAAGHSTNDALAAADFVWNSTNKGPMPWARVGVVQPVAARSALGADGDDDVDTLEDDDASEDAAPDLLDTPAAPATLEADTGEVDPETIEAEVKSVMAAMGSGDFVGYQDRLKDLARRAHKPARIVEVAAIDTSKIKGVVPKIVAQKDMRQAGLPALAGRINVKATVMPVYNAPDTPKVDPDYHWHEMTGMIISVLRRGQPVFLTGPAGTGKTEFAKQIAARWGRPFVRISCDDQTEAQTLVGMTVPSKDGGTTWQDGQLAAAIRRPGTVILVDEPSVARPGALFVLQAVMDGDKKLHVAETGEVIHVAPDVLLLLADNTNGTGDESGQYEATRRLNKATLDRPDVFVRFDYLSPIEEAQVIHAKTGVNKKTAALLAKFAAFTRAKAHDGKLSHGLGLRRLLALASVLRDGANPVHAFQAAVIEGAPYDDKEPLRQFWTADVDQKQLSDSLKAAA